MGNTIRFISVQAAITATKREDCVSKKAAIAKAMITANSEGKIVYRALIFLTRQNQRLTAKDKQAESRNSELIIMLVSDGIFTEVLHAKAGFSPSRVEKSNKNRSPL